MSSSLIVIRGSDQIGPFSAGDLENLVAKGVLLPEDSCFPEGRPDNVRPVFFWISRAAEERSVHEASAFSDDPLLAGRIPLEGDTPVSRSDPPPPADPEADEQTLYRGRPTILAYGKWLVLIALLATGSLFLGYYGEIYVLIVFTLLVLAIILLSLDRYNKLYLVTNRRVEIVEGLIALSSREVRIPDIRAINVTRSGLLGMLGVGTVEFASAGSDEVEVAFPNVARAVQLKHLVRGLQEKE